MRKFEVEHQMLPGAERKLRSPKGRAERIMTGHAGCLFQDYPAVLLELSVGYTTSTRLTRMHGPTDH